MPVIPGIYCTVCAWSVPSVWFKGCGGAVHVCRQWCWSFEGWGCTARASPGSHRCLARGTARCDVAYGGGAVRKACWKMWKSGWLLYIQDYTSSWCFTDFWYKGKPNYQEHAAETRGKHRFYNNGFEVEKEMLSPVIPSHADLCYLGIQSECSYGVLCANNPSPLCILSQNLCCSISPGDTRHAGNSCRLQHVHLVPGLIPFSHCRLSFLGNFSPFVWIHKHLYNFLWVNEQHFYFMGTQMHSKGECLVALFLSCCFLCASLSIFHYSLSFPEK